jgi:hypothetical protein
VTPTPKVIEVPLPERARPTPEELETLQNLFRVIAALRYEEAPRWPEIRRALAHAGWDVRWSLQWHVEARRGREMEQACGRTLDEAFGEVWQVTREESPLEGTP